MAALPNVLQFEWDKGNVEKNVIAHGVTSREAEEVFLHEPNFIVEDVKHSLTEPRFMLWGMTDLGRSLTIIFTIRGKNIRIISARDMHKKERRRYEKEIQENSKIQH
ncbi:MAG: BrnT family toxin [bacterium]|nr:BrnT family toxin [bacterium]